MSDKWMTVDPWTCPFSLLLDSMYDMDAWHPMAEAFEEARVQRTFEENRHPSRDTNCIR